MKQGGLTTPNLHQCEALSRELMHHRAQLVRELQRLYHHHHHHPPHVSDDSDVRQTKDRGRSDVGAGLRQRCGKLQDLVLFMEGSLREVAHLRTTAHQQQRRHAATITTTSNVRNHQPRPHITSAGSGLSRQPMKGKKDASILQVTSRLKQLRLAVRRRLAALQVQEEGAGTQRATDGRREEGPSPHDTAVPRNSFAPSANSPRIAGSARKQRLLTRARLVLAAKKASLASGGSRHAQPSAGQRAASGQQREAVAQRVKGEETCRRAVRTGRGENAGGGGDRHSEGDSVCQQQQEVTSVSPRDSDDSWGHSVTNSSLMTSSSTASSLLGDSSPSSSSPSSSSPSSSAITTDHSDVTPLSDGGDSWDSSSSSWVEGMGSQGEDVPSAHVISGDVMSTHVIAPRRAASGTRRGTYIQLGLPQQQHALPDKRQRRHGQSGLGSDGGSDGEDLGGHHWSTVTASQPPPPPSPPCWPDQAAPPCLAGDVLSEQWSDSGCGGRSMTSSGVSSRTSSMSSASSWQASNTEDRVDDEVRASSEKDQSGGDHVTVRLVTADDVHTHRGPGLVDRHTRADHFVYPKQKTLEELCDFVNRRMQVHSRGRVRLWLFDQDGDGLFLPRRLLTGQLAKNTVGSLNRDTVTLFVQTAEPRERLFVFHHQKIRFVFVKAPHWETGEFVIKGHHHIDVTKATRAIIQVLKKKFMPQCPSPLRLYIETGGKKMYHVPHSPVSIFHSDTQGSSRHGDVLVLLEDFVDQQSALSHASRDTSFYNPSRETSTQLLPLSPGNTLSPSRLTDGDTCSEVFLVTSDTSYDVTEDRGVSKRAAAAKKEFRQRGRAAVTRTDDDKQLFVIPCDSHTSTSDESVTSPRTQVPQWDLTSHYLARHPPSHPSSHHHHGNQSLGRQQAVAGETGKEEEEEGARYRKEAGMHSEGDCSQRTQSGDCEKKHSEFADVRGADSTDKGAEKLGGVTTTTRAHQAQGADTHGQCGEKQAAIACKTDLKPSQDTDSGGRCVEKESTVSTSQKQRARNAGHCSKNQCVTATERDTKPAQYAGGLCQQKELIATRTHVHPARHANNGGQREDKQRETSSGADSRCGKRSLSPSPAVRSLTEEPPSSLGHADCSDLTNITPLSPSRQLGFESNPELHSGLTSITDTGHSGNTSNTDANRGSGNTSNTDANRGSGNTSNTDANRGSGNTSNTDADRRDGQTACNRNKTEALDREAQSNIKTEVLNTTRDQRTGSSEEGRPDGIDGPTSRQGASAGEQTSEVSGLDLPSLYTSGPSHSIEVATSVRESTSVSEVTSDREESVYFTPRPVAARLQSTGLTDTANSLSGNTQVGTDPPPRQVSHTDPSPDVNPSRNLRLDPNTSSEPHPDQISAITNRSSSFMAIKTPWRRLDGAGQISAIPNISSSFMDIPDHRRVDEWPSGSLSVSAVEDLDAWPPLPSSVCVYSLLDTDMSLMQRRESDSSTSQHLPQTPAGHLPPKPEVRTGGPVAQARWEANKAWGPAPRLYRGPWQRLQSEQQQQSTEQLRQPSHQKQQLEKQQQQLGTQQQQLQSKQQQQHLQSKHHQQQQQGVLGQVRPWRRWPDRPVATHSAAVAGKSSLNANAEEFVPKQHAVAAGQPGSGKPISVTCDQPGSGKPISVTCGQPGSGKPISVTCGQPGSGKPISVTRGQPGSGKPISVTRGQSDCVNGHADSKTLARGTVGSTQDSNLKGAAYPSLPASLPQHTLNSPPDQKPASVSVRHPVPLPANQPANQPASQPTSPPRTAAGPPSSCLTANRLTTKPPPGHVPRHVTFADQPTDGRSHAQGDDRRAREGSAACGQLPWGPPGQGMAADHHNADGQNHHSATSTRRKIGSGRLDHLQAKLHDDDQPQARDDRPQTRDDRPQTRDDRPQTRDDRPRTCNDRALGSQSNYTSRPARGQRRGHWGFHGDAGSAGDRFNSHAGHSDHWDGTAALYAGQNTHYRGPPNTHHPAPNTHHHPQNTYHPAQYPHHPNTHLPPMNTHYPAENTHHPYTHHPNPHFPAPNTYHPFTHPPARSTHRPYTPYPNAYPPAPNIYPPAQNAHHPHAYNPPSGVFYPFYGLGGGSAWPHPATAWRPEAPGGSMAWGSVRGQLRSGAKATGRHRGAGLYRGARSTLAHTATPRPSLPGNGDPADSNHSDLDNSNSGGNGPDNPGNNGPGDSVRGNGSSGVPGGSDPSKNDPGSTGSKQGGRVRRGYIQLGLETSVKPAVVSTASRS